MSDETELQTKAKTNKVFLIGAVVVIAIALVAAVAIFLPKSAEAKKHIRQAVYLRYRCQL